MNKDQRGWMDRIGSVSSPPACVRCLLCDLPPPPSSFNPCIYLLVQLRKQSLFIVCQRRRERERELLAPRRRRRQRRRRPCSLSSPPNPHPFFLLLVFVLVFAFCVWWCGVRTHTHMYGLLCLSFWNCCYLHQTRRLWRPMAE